MYKLIIALILVVVLGAVASGVFYVEEKKTISQINSFEDCVNHGFPIMESYPEQCRTPDGRNFTAEIEPTAPTHELIKVFEPSFGEKVSSPLKIRGEAKGFWFFEANFPIRIFDQEGNLLSTTIATTSEEWMTEDFVPFSAILTFDPGNSISGTLIFEKDNPSGLPEKSDSFEMQVYFK